MGKYKRIVLNIPHSSIEGITESTWPLGKLFFGQVRNWTDWYTDYLFGADLKEICPVRFNKSRFIVDVERLEDDPLESAGQGIVYEMFDNIGRKVSISDREAFMSEYHRHIQNLKTVLTDQSILIDCHSFPSTLSDIEVCIGFNNDWSKPDIEVIQLVADAFANVGYKVGINEPYSNSISPTCSFFYHSLMIEINKSTYMDEVTLSLTDKAIEMKKTIEDVYTKILLL